MSKFTEEQIQSSLKAYEHAMRVGHTGDIEYWRDANGLWNSKGLGDTMSIPGVHYRVRPKTHDLKTDPGVFDAVAAGKKTFEIRYDDRGFKEGDYLILKRTKHSGAEMKCGLPLLYTGETLQLRVLHVLRGPIYGLAEGWVIMSIGVCVSIVGSQ